MSKSYDIVVLGGGPGGYVAAIRAAQLGYKTAIIEKDNLGGVCLNWGCIPTKSLLKNAELYDLAKNHSDEYGLSFTDLKFDFAKIIQRSRGVSEKIVKGVQFLVKKNKIDHIQGFGKFISKNKLEVLDSNKKKIEEVEGKHIIIATGARPRSIDAIPIDHKNIITSTEAMSLDKQPKDLIVIGAGAIGVEFAYFYNVLGTEVTIIEMMDNILPIEDKEVSDTLARSFKKRGIKIHTGTKVEKAETKGKSVVVTIEKNGKKEELKAEKVLSAIGVQGNVEGIGLEEIGVEIEKGHIKVDKHTYKTNIDGVYAIGDVIGAPWLAHVASHEGVHCIEKIHGINHGSIDYNSIPGCTYCQPQVASIGLTEAKAKEKGYEYKVGKFPYSASGKAGAIGEREGFVKIIFDSKYGEILGAHIIGAEATELIAEIGIAKSLEATYETILGTVHAHPTLSEMVMEAAGQAYGEAIHI
ncbi:MAG: dihydrolipoyl dehydrogenase [Melioribacteraceae bacterium]|nr:dihydrolipoyl dehydrogenase [Melioribacteraceae bacterium]WKZ70735.1 MAG: dihydrolipoyl dehydrogenase [Melioribacteraceae bacterium]